MSEATRILSEFCENIAYEDIPQDVIDRTKLLLLDTIGIIVRARHDSESTDSLLAGIDKLGLNDGNCSVFGDTQNYAPAAAALINGTLAHSLDFDDTHAEASVHASAPIIPAAIAAAQLTGASGRELLTACVVGYETHIRLGEAVGAADHYERGFHPSATCGIFAAAAAAGKILKLTSEQFRYAFGIALSQSAGSMQFLTDGAWTKRLHVGQASQNGLMAAFYAHEGFKGPEEAFEGKWGFFNSYSSAAKHDRATEGLGKSWKTMTLGVKPYPSCRYSHAAIDGILDILEESNLDTNSDIKIDVGLSKRGYGIIGNPLDQKQQPKSIVDGQFSMPFSAAVAFKKHGLVWDDYRECLDDIDTLELCKNINVYIDDEAESFSPENMSAKVKIHAGDESYERFVQIPKGEPENFMSGDEFLFKFNSLCAPYMTDGDMARLSDSILSLESRNNIAEALFSA